MRVSNRLRELHGEYQIGGGIFIGEYRMGGGIFVRDYKRIKRNFIREHQISGGNFFLGVSDLFRELHEVYQIG